MQTTPSSTHPKRARFALLAVLFFLSGFAALVYQVLWVRELGLLFGSTAQAAAMAIGVFFAGIALGSWFWGKRARRVGSALAAFGWLEVGVAATALGHFLLLDAYHIVYPALYPLLGDLAGADTALKCLIAVIVLGPPAFLMGGTLPMMGQYLIRSPERMGRLGSLLYAINTGGAALGALAAGFFLPLWLGFSGAYLLAIGLDVLIGVTALGLARRWQEQTPQPVEPDTTVEILADTWPGRRLAWMIALMSGICALGVEVIWTRLFSQVLQNSVYTYSLVLVVFLLSLSLGALLANRLSRLTRPGAGWIMAGLLIAAGLLVAISPQVFHGTTGGLGYVGAGLDWSDYLRSVVLVAVLVMLVPGVVLGTVLPYLLRLLENARLPVGELIGRLVAVNTVGGIVGAVGAGFVLLPLLGASRTLLLLGGLYVATAGLLMLARTRPVVRLAAVAVLAMAVVLPLSPLHGVGVVSLNEQRQERLIDYIEGSHATAAVIERDGHLLIRVNNHYTLGGTGALESERNQSLIPLLIHPEPKSIFYLGMGTGITSGAGLLYPVERVVVCELLPEVVQLAERHFGPWTEGLFEDPRVTIHAEDGRNCLRRSPERYDLIISDLFTPWKAGTGNLYTLELYRAAAQRLEPGGLFVQWIPSYQVSETEFGIIARTMDEVFDEVLLWRGDLFPSQSVIALVGQNQARPLDPEAPIRNGRLLADNPDLPEDLLSAVALRFYAGNISASGLYADAAINTDNRALIEYLAPRTQRKVQAGRARWLTGDQLGLVYEQLLRNPGLANDPYLAHLDTTRLGYVVAGRSYFHFGVYRMASQDDRARHFLDDFLDRTPFRQPPPEPEPPTTLSDWEEPAAP